MTDTLTTELFGYSPRGRSWILYTIRTMDDFRKAVGQSKPVVLMFSADWNEPSKVMRKQFWKMAYAKKRAAIFCVVDIDKLKDLTEQYGVEALPTFMLFKDGSEKERVVGAKVDELKTTIQNKI